MFGKFAIATDGLLINTFSLGPINGRSLCMSLVVNKIKTEE